MLLAQLSDTHIVDPNSPLDTFVDNNDRLRQAVERLNQENVPVDAVLLTGDTTDLGTDGEMNELGSILEPLQAPILPIPGNHDRKDSFRSMFAMDWASETNLSWVVVQNGVRIIGLDTVVASRDQAHAMDELDHGGEFDDERATWLDAVLNDDSETPTILAMHHPPFLTGIKPMDDFGLRGRDRFAQTISGHANLTRIVAGHIHRSIFTTVAGVPTSTTPSTAHQVELDLDPAGPLKIICDSAGYQLHRFNGSIWQTHERHIDSGVEPITLGL